MTLRVARTQGAPISLPWELEREIFETTVAIYPRSVINLVVVARRAQIWMETILYKDVTLTKQRVALKFLTSKSSDFLSKHVKTLSITEHVHVPEAASILTNCAGVCNLACWAIPESHATPTLLPIIAQLRHLKRLSVGIRIFPKRFSMPNITHLDMVNPWSLWNEHAFVALPNVTHLSFRFWPRPSIVVPLGKVLEDCLSLRVLVLLTPPSSTVKSSLDFLQENGIDDRRIHLVRSVGNLEYWTDFYVEGRLEKSRRTR
ncbi:hypothetical protein C8J56DRAFT_1065099 [Mycena floridula]|nr:hypothetical protein C8J56DRAFT_1065099 [Mycena floridula]